MGLDAGLGAVVMMTLRWLFGLAIAIGLVVLVAWSGDRLRERWETRERR